MLVVLLTVALAQVMALPGRAPAEAERSHKVVEPVEQPPPQPIQVIRRVKVEKALPIETQAAAQSAATGKTEVKQGEKGNKK